MMFPVEAKIGEISAVLAANRNVVLTAPPGSGKTTAVPPALLDAPWLKGKKIVMLEPRRLAARNCATYISRKLGEPVGGTVGYQVRLERKLSAKTRLEVVTEGLLTQRILSDPELSEVGLVIFDEFHERSLNCDLAYALALEVRRALRPDLRLMVMSATLDARAIAAHLGDATVVRAEGRMFPVETVYLGEISMTAAVIKALRETEGDILCFLPGEGEIRRTWEDLNSRAELKTQVAVLPLFGSLPKEEQDKVFDRSPLRKVILSTSIAETSLTIEGITCVIDSGLMRVPRFSPGTGMSALVTLPLTRDRAEQRRGRAGRVRPGIAYRLWTLADEASHPERMMPEILDQDLAPLVMTSAAWGALRREDLPWMTVPPASAWEQATGLLRLLGAIDERGALTAKGERMAKLPMHPRLANMLLGGGDPMLAAIIEEGVKSRETDIRYVPRTPRVRELAKRFGHNAFESSSGLSPGAALALAYPDRIAKNRGNGTFQMVSGRGAFFEYGDPLAQVPYAVLCELDDRAGDAKVFLACPIAEAEIDALFGDDITEVPFCEWDSQNDRVKSVVRRKLGKMTLCERPAANGGDDANLVEALLEGVRRKGIENLPCWSKETVQLRARMRFLAKAVGQSGNAAWPDPTDELVLSSMAGFVGGMTKWQELAKLDIAAVLDFILSEAGHDRRELDRLAPTRMEVPSGSKMTIHYEGAEPTVEVRLQECFGLMTTPKVAGGRVPIVMTLLSPAQRPIQVTKDLEGFWKGAYQLVRKDMRGRYPKHYWPEDPLAAVATRRTVKRANR